MPTRLFVLKILLGLALTAFFAIEVWRGFGVEIIRTAEYRDFLIANNKALDAALKECKAGQ
jgi:hypothetical protein